MKEVAYAIITEVYQQCSFAETAKAVVDNLLAAKTISAIVEAMPSIAQLHKNGHDELNAAKLASFTSFEGQFTDSNPQERFKFAISSKSNHLDISWPTQYGKPLVGALVKVAQSLRDKQRDPSFFDFVVSHRLLLVVQSGSHFRMHRHSTSGIFYLRKTNPT